MSEHPILFSAPMVRALLDGRKTMTRRVLKPQPVPFRTGPNNTGPECDVEAITLEGERPRLCLGRVITGQKVTRWATGDRLWVREAWRASSAHDELVPAAIPEGDSIEYAADPERILTGRNRPSIHMPRWASRITLAVEAVRVERLNDISEGDARGGPADGSAAWRLGFRADGPEVCRGDGWAHGRGDQPCRIKLS